VDDQTVLASSENFGTVSVCPGGVVHINLPHCSLKFLPSDFVKFSELIAKARLKFDLPLRGDGKPRLQIVSTEADKSTESDQDE
jgi:hypothetical protein